ETHDLCIGLTLGVEVRAALTAAHGQGGERVLEGLLESQELEDGQIHRGVKAHPALVRANSGAVLDAEGTIDVDLALIVDPGDAELNRAFGFNQALQKPLFGVARVAFDEWPEAAHDLVDRLHELRLVWIAGLDTR